MTLTFESQAAAAEYAAAAEELVMLGIYAVLLLVIAYEAGAVYWQSIKHTSKYGGL